MEDEILRQMLEDSQQDRQTVKDSSARQILRKSHEFEK